MIRICGVAVALVLVAMACSVALAQTDDAGNVIGLLMVPELMPPNPCEAVAPTAVPLYSAPAATAAIGELRVVRGPLDVVGNAESCQGGPDVRAIFGRSSFELATEEHGYEEKSLVVTAAVPGWYQVKTGGRPELVWMRPTARSVYRPVERLLEEGLTYLTSKWDRRLYMSPYGGFRTIPPSRDGQFNVRVNGVATVDDVLWARVTFVSPCAEDVRADVPVTGTRGWVRVHGDRALMVCFYSRGC